MTQPTKADLAAENTALRALLTVIGGALPERPADYSDRNEDLYHYACRERLAVVAIVTRCAMEYSDERSFVNVLRNSARTLTGDLAKPLPYATVSTEPEPTLHQKRLQAAREGRPEVQDGPYAYVRQGG